MRVLLVVHALPAAGLGGTELYTGQLAETLAGDHEVAVATPRGLETDVDGATVLALPDVGDWSDPTGRESGLTRGVVHEEVDRRFADHLDAFAPDVVHCQHLKFLSASVPEICADHGIPCLLTLHDFWTVCHREQLYQPAGVRCSGPDSVAKCTTCYVDGLREGEAPAVSGGGDEGDAPAVSDGGGETPGRANGEAHVDGTDEEPVDATDCWNAVERRTEQLRAAREAADRLIAPSQFLRERFVSFGTSPERVVHVRNGVRLDPFADAGFDPAEPLVVGFAGRITPQKGVHVLLAAFERLHGDAELHVFGAFDPDAEPYHARLRERAGEVVTFHGRYESPATPYETVDVLVVPSIWYENSPLVVQEAFASGVPVVAGDVGGMAELVTDGVDGRTFAVGDPDALADVLGELARSPATVEALRRGVEPPKSLDEHAGELVTRYESTRSREVYRTA